MNKFVYLFLGAPLLVFACDDDGDTTTPTATSSGTGGNTTSTTDGGAGTTTSSGGGTATGTGSGGSGSCATPDPDCETILAGFTACGGDVTGTWDLLSACHVWGGPGPNPSCSDNVVETATGPAAGTWVFDATDVTVTGYEVAQTGHSLYSSNCAGTPGDCPTIEALTLQAWPTACCEMIDATTCECFATGPLQSFGDPSSAYSTNGNTLTLGSVDTEYCVSGTTLSVRYDGGTEDEVVQIFEQQ